MRLSNTPMRTAAAALSVCAMALTVSACGSEEETQSGGLSTAATAPGGATNPAEPATQNGGGAEGDAAKPADGSAAAATSKAKNSTAAQGAPGAPGGNDDPAAIPSLVNPFAEGDLAVPTYEPISGGKEGSEADRRQMEETVRAITNPDSFAGWTRTILDNSCAAVREPAMKQFESQGLTLDMVEQIMQQQGEGIEIPKTEVSLSDVRVDGNRASATVTSNTPSGQASQVQLFAKEDGRWKVCTD